MLSRDSITHASRDSMKALFSSTFPTIPDIGRLVFFWSLHARRMLRTHTRLRENDGDETRV
jgi:hypothetical protein